MVFCVRKKAFVKQGLFVVLVPRETVALYIIRGLQANHMARDTCRDTS